MDGIIATTATQYSAKLKPIRLKPITFRTCPIKEKRLIVTTMFWRVMSLRIKNALRSGTTTPTTTFKAPTTKPSGEKAQSGRSR